MSDAPRPDSAPGEISPPEVLVRGSTSSYTQEVIAGSHHLTADEPLSLGGQDQGPTPYQFLLAALGACTSITLTMYARRSGWPLEEVTVRLRHEKVQNDDSAESEPGPPMIDRIERVIELRGPLDPSQRDRLLKIAERCPVHKTLASKVFISTRSG